MIFVIFHFDIKKTRIQYGYFFKICQINLIEIIYNLIHIIILKDMASCSQDISGSISYFIPFGRNWLKESPTQASLTNPMIRLTSSSSYRNSLCWHPCWILNGNKEISGQNGWATDDKNQQFLILSFKEAVCANVIYILSRGVNFDQSPTAFEIWGSNDSFDYHFIEAFEEPNWEASQEKHFRFNNIESYNHYKIIFNTSNSSIFGISGLNIGKIEN